MFMLVGQLTGNKVASEAATLAPVTRKGQLVMFDCAVVPCLPYCPSTLKFILILGILGIIVLRDSARTCCGTWEERQSSGLPSSTVQCCC